MCVWRTSNSVSILSWKSQAGTGGAPTFGTGTCVWLSLLPWGAATAGARRAPPPPLGLPAAVSQAPVPFGGGMCGLAGEGTLERKCHWLLNLCVFVSFAYLESFFPCYRALDLGLLELSASWFGRTLVISFFTKRSIRPAP